MELFCASIQRLRTELDMFIPCVIVGDAEHYEICSKYHITHIAMDNHPATRKWNAGVDYLKSLGVDYYLISGSDDLMSADLIKNLMARMEQGIDLIGINTIYFYSTDDRHRGRMRKLIAQGQILGVARCISKRVAEAVGGNLWNIDKSWGMDGICLKNILPHVKSRAIVQGFCCDLKSQRESLNKFSYWQGRIPDSEDPKQLYEILSEEELRLLIQIK